MKGIKRQLSEDSISSSSSYSSEDYERKDNPHFQLLLDQIPGDIYSDAHELLHMMATSKGIIYWNKKRELTYHRRAISKSNLCELIEYILYPEEEEDITPRGLNTFLKGLAELKIDKALIGNHTVLET